MMGAEDWLSVVAFSSSAYAVTPLTKMDAEGKAAATAAISYLKPDGGTDLAGALTLAYSMPPATKRATIVVLTDGEPSTRPPRGFGHEVGELAKLHPGRALFTVGFGMGTALDTDVLAECATAGGGIYAYVPDGSMVGTVFIHLMANLLCAPPSPPLVGARAVFVARLRQAYNLAAFGNFDAARGVVEQTYAELEGEDAMRADLIDPSPNLGQVSKALGAWAKWGRHYLLALIHAHQWQWAMNFKDRTMALYGTPATKAKIAAGETIFRSLPPATKGPAINIQTMLNASGGCFGEQTQIKMLGGGTKQVADLCKGDVLVNGATVRALVVYHNVTCGLFESAALQITAWHPFRRVHENWRFPANTDPVLKHFVGTVYNIVLDGDPWVESADGWQCVTLGHGLQAPVVKHAYFGTQRVIDDLVRQGGFEAGRVEFKNPVFSVSRETGVVEGVADV
jgi:hypothetical protein